MRPVSPQNDHEHAHAHAHASSAERETIVSNSISLSRAGVGVRRVGVRACVNHDDGRATLKRLVAMAMAVAMAS